MRLTLSQHIKARCFANATTDDGLKPSVLSKPILFFFSPVAPPSITNAYRWILFRAAWRGNEFYQWRNYERANSISNQVPVRFIAHRPQTSRTGKSVDGKVCSNSPPLLPDANLRRRNSIGHCRLNRVQLGPIRFPITRRQSAINAAGDSAGVKNSCWSRNAIEASK